MRKFPTTQVTDGWWRDSRDRLILPEKLGHTILTKILQDAHPHATAQGHRKRGTIPGAHWEVDFTEVKPDKYGYKYLLVFVDTFSGWTEAFPTKKETAQIVAKKILEEILPRALQRVHEAVWPKLKELYETGPPPTPHQYRLGDWVLVKRHRQENLEPR
ncbi:uncharacterized protein LOC121026634 isoform X1 [Herpailurus yagouaroundi]|uniref:uncharacterized protein LOC121026634 isoform X1 n=1 Tax=Herpailurus yagouaroundi TaxID=1608482 RepID=UPI001AD6504B|nr:uncharacterized protein LOC121026634 isoform X1 [Puma yagouaroundi]